MRTALFITALLVFLAATACIASAQSGAAATGPSREGAARIKAVCGRSAEYGCYTNHKYGYVAAWPKRYLKPEGESDSGDGQRFMSPDGRASLACWGSFHTVLGQSLKAAFAEATEDPGATVTYKRLGKDFFVVSGLREGRIFYRKTIRSGEVEASFELDYDPALKPAFDPVVKDLAGSFAIAPDFTWRTQ